MNSFLNLRLNKEFKRAYGRGKTFVDSAVVVYVLKTKRQQCRIGITTSKKLGCAVERNRARRVITAAFRACLPDIAVGCDIVFVARTRILKRKSTQIAEVFRKALAEAGVCEENI